MPESRSYIHIYYLIELDQGIGNRFFAGFVTFITVKIHRRCPLNPKGNFL